MTTNTIKLHRVLRSTPEKSTAPSWSPRPWPNAPALRLHLHRSPHGGQSRRHLPNVVHKLRLRQRPFVRGTYAELVPNERIRYTDKFDDPNFPGEMSTTITLRPVMCGTELNVTQEGVPAAIPAEMCYFGWQESLEQLARLVEPEIPE